MRPARDALANNLREKREIKREERSMKVSHCPFQLYLVYALYTHVFASLFERKFARQKHLACEQEAFVVVASISLVVTQ